MATRNIRIRLILMEEKAMTLTVCFGLRSILRDEFNALENSAAGKLVVRWGKITGTGYQIQYSTSSTFKTSF